MPDPFTIAAALTLGAIGTMIAAGSDDSSEDSSSSSSSSSSTDPCDWSYDDNDYSSSGGDRQTTLSEFD